ncbi:MAG TPA: DciA family protein [Stellaceae bacterium]|nr:DciA family protein [Stellaceae bacterium]
MSETNLSGAGSGSERGLGFRAAGAAVPRIVGPIVARHGGGILVRLKSHWGAIVGAELAAATWPEALARGGTLKLRVTPAKALEVQHRSPLLIERVNLFFGRAAVTRLALVQGPLPLAAPAARPASRSPAPAAAAALDRQLAAVENPELRDVLARLGRRVMGEPE